jgi:release factor glutamine methyltransferase
LTINELQKKFISALSGLYPSEEIGSFFAILCEKYLGLSRIDLTLKKNEEISEANSENFKNAILRLKEFEPVQYIIGETEFYGLRFKVNKHSLIPRPETEELVDWVLSDTKAAKMEPKTLLDIGTGSGCIAISLAKNLPKIKVSALDLSSEALKIVKVNAQINEVEIDFLHLDILNLEQLPGKYDRIVSNPPYVREQEKKDMQANVLKYEPGSALFVSNDDPLLFYRKIAMLAKRHLNFGGLLYFEINEYLGNEMILLLQSLGFGKVTLKKDNFGKDRFIRCRPNE